MRKIFPLVLAASITAAMPAFAKVPLRDVAEIDDGLFAVAVADEIRKQCNSISARMFRALGYMNALERRARDLGYSKAEIDAYVKSPDEKARMRKRGEAYLKANGVSYADPETFCTLGRAEISKGTQIGQLLRAK
ncbi:DUF5333 domain-containing protein [Thalassovita sp.]|jgi:hypothetical protein|uniref:DUF5333 domain-containing protein n=1 Tax=Thalassovita sp. TaxID=1979401 RepID=UPI003B58CDC1